MRRIAEWIKRHKLCSGLILLGTFILPILIVHLLFKIENGPIWLQAKWDAGDILTYVAGFEAFIGTVSLGALSLWQNEQIHNEHIESLEPCLSMQLVSVKHEICLEIENTGAVEAKEILISIMEITENGENSEINNGGEFGPFELYPKEKLQRAIADSGENIVTRVSPKIKIHVSYLRPDIQRKKEYDRTVSYSEVNNKNTAQRISIDDLRITSDLNSMARAGIRIANYLDGHQLQPIDEINILTDRSLRNDLAEVKSSGEKAPVVRRSEIIGNSKPGGKANA